MSPFSSSSSSSSSNAYHESLSPTHLSTCIPSTSPVSSRVFEPSPAEVTAAAAAAAGTVAVDDVGCFTTAE